MKNIAFVGPMHSGKSSAAAYLIERYGYERIGLADAVKACGAVAVNGFMHAMELCGEPPPREFLTVDDMNDNKAAFRPFLQWLGTDLARHAPDPAARCAGSFSMTTRYGFAYFSSRLSLWGSPSSATTCGSRMRLRRYGMRDSRLFGFGETN